MFPVKKKENNLDVLTEDKIRQKLYGYLNENKQQKAKFVKEKPQPAQNVLRPEMKPEIKKEAEVKNKNPEKEKPAAVKEEIKTLPRAEKPAIVNVLALKSAIKKIEGKLFLACRVCFAQIKKLKVLFHKFQKARDEEVIRTRPEINRQKERSFSQDEERSRREEAMPRLYSGQTTQPQSEKTTSLAKNNFGIGSIGQREIFQHHFTWRTARSLMIVILILVLGLFVLNINKNPGSSSPDLKAASKTAAIPVKKTEVTIPGKAPFYTIQVCVYEKEKDARRLIEELKQKKFDAYLSADNSKSRTKYQVYVGKFSSSDNAKATLGKLKSMFKDSFVRFVN